MTGIYRMKRKIITLAVLSAITGMAHAQSGITIYGVADVGLIKESGASTSMNSNETSRIGFRGKEDLGNGLKATFQLEQRLNLNDGTNANSNNSDLGWIQDANRNMDDLLHNRNAQWAGGANIGLEGSFGVVRFGRVAELSTESYSAIDPFEQNGVGSSLYSILRSEALSNTVRYDSPAFNGFSAGVSYSLKTDSNTTALLGPDERNAGYAASLKYENGPVYLIGNYSRLADSNKSRSWNLGGAYAIGNVKVSLGYEHTSADESIFSTSEDIKQKNWLVGLSWQIGQGTLKASYNHGKTNHFDTDSDGKVKKYALGYTYSLSKRTSAYGTIAHTKSDSPELGTLFNGNGVSDDSVTSYQIGLNHKF